ncbi:MAG: hypothetical protein WD448_09350 [Woeseia sp.]
MKLIIGIALLIILIAVFFRRRSRGGHVEEARRKVSTTPGDMDAPGDLRNMSDGYHAVSIQPGEKACKAARSIEGQRFLSSEAPRIPLPNCDAVDCSCRFAHHEDRRADESRRRLFAASVPPREEKRTEAERRQ